MAELFQTTKQNISLHLKTIFSEKELYENSVVKEYLTTASDGRSHRFYSLVRTVWDAELEKWFVSIIDVVAILTDSPNPRKYWSVLKTRLKAEGSQLATNCSQLKMQSSDGKYYKTDADDAVKKIENTEDKKII